MRVKTPVAAARQAGDICPDCELIRLPGALCPFHAAAPDLLNACRRIVTLTAGHPLLAAELDVPLVKAAIAKAEGQ